MPQRHSRRFRNRNRRCRTIRCDSRRYRRQSGGWKETNANFVAYKATNVGQVGTIDSWQKKFNTLVQSAILKATGVTVPLREIDYTYDYSQLSDKVPREDDSNYSEAKFTIVPKGTIVYRRQTTPDFLQNLRYTWFDYSGRFEPTSEESVKKSYLKNKLDENANDTRIKATKGYFGKYLLKLCIKKDLLIFHFPESVPSHMENYVRWLVQSGEVHSLIKTDGYTLDFLQFNPNEIYKPLPSVTGYRELSSPSKNFDLVEVSEST